MLMPFLCPFLYLFVLSFMHVLWLGICDYDFGIRDYDFGIWHTKTAGILKYIQGIKFDETELSSLKCFFPY